LRLPRHHTWSAVSSGRGGIREKGGATAWVVGARCLGLREKIERIPRVGLADLRVFHWTESI